jgi:hypothetical protein
MFNQNMNLSKVLPNLSLINVWLMFNQNINLVKVFHIWIELIFSPNLSFAKFKFN